MGGACVNTLARASLPDPSQLEMESSSQRRQRLGRLRAARARASGTELQREHRREVHRSRMRVIRQGESEARRSQRLANLAEERALETTQQRYNFYFVCMIVCRCHCCVLLITCKGKIQEITPQIGRCTKCNDWKGAPSSSMLNSLSVLDNMTTNYMHTFP